MVSRVNPSIRIKQQGAYGSLLFPSFFLMIYDTIIERTPIEKGWSPDKKYRVVTENGTSYLLRVSPPDRLDRMRSQFTRMQEVSRLGIPMCHSVECGIREEGPYVLQSWIDGSAAEDLLPALPKARQYAYGLDAGRYLNKIHSIPAPAGAEPWADRFNRKIDRKIAMYTSCPLKYDGGEAFLSHIARCRHLLSDRPQSYQHGDYHTGNMMIDANGKLVIIDFDKDDFGDPWEEFNRTVWCAQLSPAFASGLVDGYFDGPVPPEFWQLLALYICSNSLSSLPWAIAYGEGEIQVMRNQAAEILSWYNHFQTVIPNWYHKEDVL